MGIFDQIEAKLRARFGASAPTNALARGTLEMIGGLDQGLETLALKFREAGLKQQVDSWVAKGKNLPVTAAQVKTALGPELEKIARRADMTIDAAAAKVAQVIPGIVDKLTPGGMTIKGEELKQSVDRLAAKLKK
jgi:uncharacterized protein YidB (DUF937 family)